MMHVLAVVPLLCSMSRPPSVPVTDPSTRLRVATFNASLNRSKAGQLQRDLASPNDEQIRNVAEIIQRVQPDILLINEFDYDKAGKSAELFQTNYLSRSQNGAKPLVYPYFYVDEVNTGVASGQDLDNDGTVNMTPGSSGYGNDAYGFGLFPGQYGMAIYSRYPIQKEKVRSFGRLLWKDMPGALLPKKPDGSSWYSPEGMASFRLSSKGHWDVPINVEGGVIHLLVSHPTPPAFDGPEDRNGKRNHDEIRIWADYLTGGEASRYLKPQVKDGDLTPPARFVILGDMNADPVDGGSVPGAIQQLLDHPKVNGAVTPRSSGAAEATRLQQGANSKHKGPADTDTADFDERVGNLRVDYVLPSKNLNVVGTGVFWPETTDPLSRLVKMSPVAASSDHRLVYIDLQLP